MQLGMVKLPPKTGICHILTQKGRGFPTLIRDLIEKARKKWGWDFISSPPIPYSLSRPNLIDINI